MIPLHLHTLESLPRALLLRALGPYESALEAKSLPLVDLARPAASLEKDEALRRLYRELTSRKTGTLAGLAALLADVEALGSSAGVDALRAAGDELSCAVPSGPPLAAALLAALDAPEVFRHARASVAGDSLDRFVEHEPEAPARLPPLRDLGERLAGELSPWFAADDRTAYVDVLVVEKDDETVIEIVHGERERQVSRLDATGDGHRRSIEALRVAKRDYAIIDAKGRLHLRACTPRERERYRAALSTLAFGDASHWSQKPLLSLDGFLHRVPPPTAGIDEVLVTDIALASGTRSRARFTDPKDVTWMLEAAPDLVAQCRVREVRLSIVPEGKRRGRPVVLALPSGVSTGRDRAWSRVVRRYLTLSGVLAAPARGRGDADDAGVEGS